MEYHDDRARYSLSELLNEIESITLDRSQHDESDTEFNKFLDEIKDICVDQDPPAIRKVKQQDEESGVPMAIYWSTEQMCKWIADIGFPYYRDCIEKNFITGRHLILLDASTLPKIGICDFDHIKKIAAEARKLLNLEKPIRNFVAAMADPMIAYMDAKRKRGSYMDYITYRAFLQKHRRWYPRPR